MAQKRRRAFMVATLGLTAGVSHAAVISEHDWKTLSSASDQRGVPILVDLLPVSLAELIADPAGARARTQAAADRLLAELGDAAWRESLQVAPGGQATLHVTREGLQLLRQSRTAIALQPSGDWPQRAALPGSQTELGRLASAAEAGPVDVIVNLDIEGLAFETRRDGSVSYAAPVDAQWQKRSILSKWIARLQAVPGSEASVATLRTASEGASRAIGFTPEIAMRLSRRELASLSLEPSVRSLRLASETDDHAPPLIAADVAQTVAPGGTADVLIFVRSLVPQPRRTNESMAVHLLSMRSMLDDVARQLPGVGKLQQMTHLGVLSGRVDRATLAYLSAASDARIRAVSLNKPLGQPALSVSNQTMNMPMVWSAPTVPYYPYGNWNGATVIVMDTGIQSNHPFFGSWMGPGFPRVSRQRCFGTTDTASGVVTVCPSPNNDGDSAAAGSAEVKPPSAGCPWSQDFCGHGTGVAGVAAGMTVVPNPDPNLPVLHVADQRSMAYSAGIWSYQIYSNASGTPRAMATDVLAALNDVLAQATLAGPNPWVVNISSQAGPYPTPCIDSSVDETNRAIYQQVAIAVANLRTRGVPVVAATGNGSSRGSVSFPACIPGVLKVTSVANSGPAHGVNTVPDANAPNPVAFGLASGAEHAWAGIGGGFEPGILGWPSYRLNVPTVGAPYTDTRASAAGTSFAAPHIAGAFTIYKAASPGASVLEMANYFYGTGRTYPVRGLPNGVPYEPNGYRYKGLRFLSM